MASGSPEKVPPADGDAFDWLAPGRFVLLLGLLIAACFPQVIGGFETFFAEDFAAFGYPLAAHHRDCFWAGELPLWNPYNSCGMPFLAQWNTMTLYPFSLFYLLLPLSWALGVFCLGHLFLAGAGMYFLARRWTTNNLAAAVAGACFAFNGLTWFGLMWPNNLAALGWMPWVVLTMEQAWTEPAAGRPGRALVLAALAGTMQMLAGAPEVIIQTWLALGALWLVQFCRGGWPRPAMLRRALGIGLLVAGLTAAQMLPFLGLLAHSQRTTQFDNSAMLAMPPYGWANFLVPLFHCFYSPRGVLIQPMQGWVGSYYVGVATIALALYAVWRVRNHRAWLLGSLALFSLTMALGNHFVAYPLAKSLVPFIGFMRFPIKFVMLGIFVFPLLAAFGLNRLLAAKPGEWPREWTRFRILACGLLGLMAFILWTAWRHPLGTDNVAATAINGLLRAGFLVLIVAAFVLVRRERETRRQRLWQAGLMLLIWCDVFTHAPNLSPTVSRSVYEPDAIRQFFNWDRQLRPEVSRAMETTASRWKMLTTTSTNAETDLNGQRLSQLINLNLLDHAANVDGFYALDLKEFGEISRLLYLRTNETSALKDFMMVALVNNPTNAVDWVTRPSALPLITAGQTPVFIARDDELNALIDGRFDPRRMVVLPAELRGQVRAGGGTAVQLGPVQFSAPRVEFAVEAAAPAMIVVAQAFYYPWRAYVDGQRVPLWRANHAFQALETPAGRHQVALVYEDKLFSTGAAASFISALACAAIWFGPLQRRRNSAGWWATKTKGSP